ncbi:acyl-CoA dehydrogenase family protein [Pseudorhodoferax sp.]|uniref:acyl-CoA dehydrogenase family protein n=1 Tax=Pseudorhodoferax sp. TaxID=1993553 RepID=UPI002DD696E8|nr:acyl-CoA dehydrogenase family protein [Pseudorhodoferax sp.]
MQLRFTPEQAAFRDEVRAFIRERLPRDIRERMRAGHPARKQDTIAWQRILNERGWAAPHWPRAYGGADLDTVRRLILVEETFRAPAPEPLVFNINLLGTVLLRYGTEAQKRFFLPRLANADLWFCQGFSEPGAGSDLAALRTRAVRQGGHYTVDGQKIWTSAAHHADWMFALVRTSQEQRKQQGISFLLIDMRSPGVSVRPIIGLDGEHHLNEVFLDGVQVPVANLVGEEGAGWECAKYLLGAERSMVAAVGLCQERLDYARAMAGATVQAGRRLADDPRLAAELATLGAEIRALELTNWRYLLDPGIERSQPGFASVLKLKGSELLQEASTLVARLAGPAGIERRDLATDAALHPASAALPRYFYYRARTIAGGSSEVQKDILARLLLG